MAKAAEAVKEKPAENQENSKKQAQSVELSEANDTGTSGPGGSIGILLDMEVPVTVTIGQTEIPVKRLLQLGPGSVLKLSKPVNEPVDLYLSDSKFATGTVVVVDGRFAVKITQILGLEESSAPAQDE
jgi:flagellar motor switch protein FliN/FliY